MVARWKGAGQASELYNKSRKLFIRYTLRTNLVTLHGKTYMKCKFLSPLCLVVCMIAGCEKVYSLLNYLHLT